MNESILALQEKYYGPDKKGPPMLPHGDDPHAVRPHKRRRRVKKQTLQIPKSNEKEFTDPLVASTLPSGFPEELAFRALAAYSLLRTLSTQLALSPFTPISFLRALYLPIPSNLIGRVHVALLRKLLLNLKMGYHFGEKNQPFLDVSKKRKVDGISWPLRAGDNLQMLDSISWPVFYDDYCHLTADVLYQSMNDDKLYLDTRTMGSLMDGLNDEIEGDTKQSAGVYQGPSTLYLNEENNIESDDEFLAEEVDSDDSYDGDDTTYERRTKKKGSISKKRGRKRKSEISDAGQPTMSRFVPPQPDNNRQENNMYYQQVFAKPQLMVSSHGNGHPQNYTSTPQFSKGFEPELFDYKKRVVNAGSKSSESAGTRTEPLTITSITDGNGSKKTEVAFVPPPVSISQSPNKLISHVERLVAETPKKENFSHSRDRHQSVESSNVEQLNSAREIPASIVSSQGPDVDLKRNSDSDKIKKTAEESAHHPGLVVGKTETNNDTESPRSEMDIDHIVQQFIRGESFPVTDQQVAVVDQTDSDHDETNSCRGSVSNHHEAPEWSHFRPLRRLREGSPYHHLSLINKLEILEFLLDDILMVDAISAEMTTRNQNTSCYHLPFGRLPLPVELENMNNDDWCGVCRQEGDLICCDGCTSSYHRECSGLPRSGPLPEGKWFCPECTIVDPAMRGPLTGGRKPSIEWIDGSILKECACNRNTIWNYTTDVGYPLPTFPGSLHSNQEAEDQNVPEYLCVHGYLFYKKKGHILMKPPSLLLGDCLISHMSTLGSEVCSSWPLVQIPLSQPIFRDVNVLPASSGSKYVASFENFNPCLYENKYTPMMIGESDPVDYEGRWHHSFSFQLWDCLRPDTSSDHLVKKALKAGTSLFNPLEIAGKFVLDLEAKLIRAAFLDPKWGAVVPTDTSLQWRNAVKNCKSLSRLAKLFVKLVDAVHPLAFDVSWFNCSRTKTTWQDKPLLQNKTVHYDAGSDASLMAVMRCWQTCPVASIHCLLAREGYSLMDWIKESSPELGKTIRKRRRKRFVENTEDSNEVDKEGGSIVAPTGSAGHESLDHDEDDGDGPPVKRLRSRYSFESAHNADTTGIMSTKTSFALPRKLKFAETRNDVSGSFNLEPLWPICGRKPFPTYGSFPSGVIRYLARNAGAVVAPFVTYSNDFEVGQVANAHVWRKRMLACKSFEEFLLLASSLESYLDTSTIRKAASYAQRFNSGKNHPNANIIESYRDFRTGLLEHLVVKNKQSTATWVSSTSVDLPVMIHSQINKSKLCRQLGEETKTNLSQSTSNSSQTNSVNKPLKQNHPTRAVWPTNANTSIPIGKMTAQSGNADQYNQAMAMSGNNGVYNMMMMQQMMMQQMMMQNMMVQNFNGGTSGSIQGQQFCMPQAVNSQLQSDSNQFNNPMSHNQSSNAGYSPFQPFAQFGAASSQNTTAGHQMPLNNSHQPQATNMWPVPQTELNALQQNVGQRSLEQPSGGTLYNQTPVPGFFPYQQQFVPQYNQNSQHQPFNSAQQVMGAGFSQPTNAMMPGSNSSILQPQSTMGSQQTIQQQSNNAYQQSPNMNNTYSQHQPNQTNSGTVMQQQPLSTNTMMPGSNSSMLQPQPTMRSQHTMQQQSNSAYQQSANMNNVYAPQQQSQTNNGTVMQPQHQSANAMMPGSNSSILQPQPTVGSHHFSPTEQQTMQHQSNSAFQQTANMNNAYSLHQQNPSHIGTVMQPQPQFHYGLSKSETNHSPIMSDFTLPVAAQNPNNDSLFQMPNAPDNPQTFSGTQGSYQNYGNFMANYPYQPQGKD